MTQPVDSSILHEIVRVIESRRKVPEKVVVKSREYLLTYLEDHQRRLEEALQRYDADRLNMLYGQLASKIKYQLLRRLPARAADALGLGRRSGAAAKPRGRKASTEKSTGQAAKAAARRPRRRAAAKKKAAAKRPRAQTPQAVRRPEAARRGSAGRVCALATRAWPPCSAAGLLSRRRAVRRRP